MGTPIRGDRFSNRLLFDLEKAKDHDRHLMRMDKVKSTLGKFTHKPNF